LVEQQAFNITQRSKNMRLKASKPIANNGERKGVAPTTPLTHPKTGILNSTLYKP